MSKLVNKIICITSLGQVNVECKQAGYMFTVVNGFLKSSINRVQCKWFIGMRRQSEIHSGMDWSLMSGYAF